MIRWILFMGIGILSCILLPKYQNIIISSMFIIIALFGKYLKIPNKTDWLYKDETEEGKTKILTNIIIFIIGLIFLIHSILSL